MKIVVYKFESGEQLLQLKIKNKIKMKNFFLTLII